MKKLEDIKTRIKGPIFINPKPQSWLEKLINYTFATVTCIISIMTIAVFWVIFCEGPKLTYENIPFKIVSNLKNIRPGDTISLEVYRCNLSSNILVYDLTRTIKNVDLNQNVILDSTKTMIDPGCSVAIQSHQIPINVKPGVYVISGVATVPGTAGVKYVPSSSMPFTVN